MPLKTGDTVAEKYVLGEKIDEDEFGSWYIAENSENQEIVQVKIVPPKVHADEKAVGRFKREIKLLSNIRHQGIITVLEVGEDKGNYFLVSEYLQGIDLGQYLEQQGVMEEKDAISLILEVVEALQYAWESQKIVHRDIKPSKIFITDDNLVKIRDLGLAKSVNDDTMHLTGAGFTVGTPDYMSPEQVSGEKLDCRADIYSLGLVLYEMVTGKKAFEGSVVEVLSKQVDEMPLPAMEVSSRVSSRCNTLIEKMIHKSRDERFETWGELIEAIQLLLDNTVMESDLRSFDVSSLNDGRAYPEPSFETLTKDDDGTFGSPALHSFDTTVQKEAAHSTNGSVKEDVVEAGTIIGNGFEIDRKVGSGSMGEIYLAFSEDGDKLVQVKILPTHMTQDQERVERFLQEIKISSTLTHPNLLSVIEAGEDNGRYYLVTDYEEGISFSDYIGRYGPLHEKDAISFLCQIAEVLNYAWKDKKLLHRDVKPENILIKEDSKEAKLTDFGIAKPVADKVSNLTGMGFTIGTPDYMSPEQVRGEEDLDSRSDMYAIGLVLYEALTKHRAFVADNPMALMNKQMTEAHKPVTDLNPKVSQNCSDLIDRLLCKNRDGRFKSWDHLLRAMRKVADGEAVPPLQAQVSSKSETYFPAQQTTASPGVVNGSRSSQIQHKTKYDMPNKADNKGHGLLIVAAVIVIVVVVTALIVML